MCTIRSAGKNKLSGDDLVSKLEEGSNKWSKASLQVLHKSWSEHGASVHAHQQVQAMFSIGQVGIHSSKSQIFLMTWMCVISKLYVSVSVQVVDIQWKLGMAVSSDTCRSLNSPYVTVLLKLVEPSGQIRQKSFEMTIPQFQVCIIDVNVVFVVGVIDDWDFFLSSFCFLQNFHKQFKEVAAVMETVWWLQGLLSAFCNYAPVYQKPLEEQLGPGVRLSAVPECGYELLQMSFVSFALQFFLFSEIYSSC